MIREKKFRKKSHGIVLCEWTTVSKKKSMLYGIILHVLYIMTDKDSCAIWETNRCIHV